MFPLTVGAPRRRGALVVLVASVVLVAAAAAGCDRPQGEASPGRARAGSGTKATRTPRAPPAPRGREVTFEATDGLTIHATLWSGATPESPAIVLVHQLSRDRHEWQPVVDRLVMRPALTVLALDLRGHGASTRRADGSEIEWRSMTNDQWLAVEADVTGAVRFLKAGAGEGLRPARIALAGSSIGSSAAIRAAVRDPAVVAVAALSPGRAYRGVDAIEPLRAWGSRRLFVLATTRDRGSAEATHDMLRVVRGSVGRIVAGEAHGLDMVSEVPGLYDELVAFLREAVDSP